MLVCIYAAHYDCPRLNAIGTNALTSIAPRLTSLNLTIAKSTRNRRGLPGPSTLDWLPTFPHLSTLVLSLCWETETDWGLTRWAPNITALTIKGSLFYGDRSNQAAAAAAFGTDDNPAPPSLSSFSFFGNSKEMLMALMRPWAAPLQSLNFNVAGEEGTEPSTTDNGNEEQEEDVEDNFILMYRITMNECVAILENIGTNVRHLAVNCAGFSVHMEGGDGEGVELCASSVLLCQMIFFSHSGKFEHLKELKLVESQDNKEDCAIFLRNLLANDCLRSLESVKCFRSQLGFYNRTICFCIGV